MKKSKETQKGIKRPFKLKKCEEIVREKTNDIVCRFNLFVLNIYNFIKTYYTKNKSDEILTNNKIFDIFLILKKDVEYGNKDSDFYKFYIETFREIYFNPLDKNKPIDGSYLDQVMKNNIGHIISSIENNIIYNHEKYINRFIKSFMSILCKSVTEYNNLIKKCSMYEFYDKINNKIINRLKKQKVFDIKLLQSLLSEINKQQKLKIKYQKKSKDNIFNDKLQEIRNFEIEFNKIKNNIKKILMNGKNIDKRDIPREYHEILNLQTKINPIKTDNYYEEIKENPYKFIQSLIYMNNYFEKNRIKTFNVFPTKSNVIPKHVTLDTASINVIFCNNSYKKLEEKKKEIYKKVFNFPDSYFKMNNKFEFTGTIQTDGVSITLLYLPMENYEKKIEINKIKHKAKNESFEQKKIIRDMKMMIEQNENKIKELSKNEKENRKEISKLSKEINEINKKIEKIKEEQHNNKKEKEDKNKKKQKEKKEKIKEQKIKVKEQIKKLKEENNTDELKIIGRKNKEFYYITDLTKKELEELKISKKLYIDQGKTELIYVLNEENGKFMSYSGKERGRMIKTKMHTNKINKVLKEKKIEKEYEELKNLNKKTTNENIIETTKKINEINTKVFEGCKEPKLRKEKIEMYIDKQKCERGIILKLIKQLEIKSIEELKEYTIIIGDWKGNNNLKNNKSTLGIGMKRMLKKYVKRMYLIDEYNTSKISNENYELFGEKGKEENYKCKEYEIELKSTEKKSGEEKMINKRMHAILTFKTEKKNIKCKYLSKEEKVNRYIQRDKNAVINFRTIVKNLLEGKEELKAFKRNNERK